MPESLSRLPKVPADKLAEPFLHFIRIEAMAGAVLLLSTVLALGLANSGWSASFSALWNVHAGVALGGFEFSRSLKHWINDALMTLFFFVIALELKRELVLGELSELRAAVLPAAAAVGGMVVPVGVFLLVLAGGSGTSGWGVVMSTDTAFVIGCLAMLGSRIPHSLRLFLLSLAIFDDVGAILVVAVGYGGSLNLVALGAAAAGLAAVAAIARLGVRSIPVYFVVGAGIWVGFDLSGIHATLAGVVLGLMTPARSWVSDRRLHAILGRVTAYPPGDHWSGDSNARDDLNFAGIATREALSPIERLEIGLHPWVAFGILPLFAFANAGVPIVGAKFLPELTSAIFLAFVLGKPLGVLLFSFLAVKLRLGVRPSGLSWSLLGAGGLLTGIGFTMALFIADLSVDAELLNSVKLAVLCASAVSAVIGLSVLRWLSSTNRHF